MLGDALKYLVGIGRETAKVEFHHHPKFPTRIWVQHGPELKAEDAPAPLREHKLLGYDDLVSAMKDKEIATNPEIYVAGGRIVALLDREERRSVVVVDLVESKRLQLCRAIEAQPRTMHPRDAVKMLRLELHGGKHETIIQSLSQVDFTRNSIGRSHVEHGRESLGKSVEASVQQADKVPKEFIVGVPVWTNNGFTRYAVNITFGVFLDMDTQAVELRVLSDECQRVVNQALLAVVSDLRESLPDVPVFLGTP